MLRRTVPLDLQPQPAQPPIVFPGSNVERLATVVVDRSTTTYAFAGVEGSTTTTIADANGKWFNDSVDAFAAAAIPLVLAVLLFVFYRVLKLFASAF